MSDENRAPFWAAGQRIEWSRNDDPESFSASGEVDTFDLAVLDEIVARLELQPTFGSWVDSLAETQYFVPLDATELPPHPEEWEPFRLKINGAEVIGYRRPVTRK